MTGNKKFKELLLKDNFLFGAVMADEEICRELLEIVLGMKISHVTVSKEYSMIYHPEFRGVRLDVYAKDADNMHYDVEVQVVFNRNLPKRSRYYHSQIDMELLLSGQPYEELPKCFVIFICDFDPFGKGLYRYTFQNRCREAGGFPLDDGSVTVFLNAHGENRSEVPPGLVSFLDFVKADLAESQIEAEDEFVKKIQASIRRIKESREMERRFMTFEELLQDQRREGRSEGRVSGKSEAVLELLQDIGPVPKELRERIASETDLKKLTAWLKAAAKAESVEAFAAGIGR